MPAKTFFESLSTNDQAKILVLFKKLADSGRISNQEQFKRERDIWAFKKFQLRFLGDFRHGGRFLVACGLKKKKDKLSNSDLATASRILGENDAIENEQRVPR